MVEHAFPDDGLQPRGGGPCIVHACGVWHDAAGTLKPAYRDVAAASCKAVVRAVNFIRKPKAAMDQINSWVKAVTHNLIDLILPRGSVMDHTRLVVATAVYFKGIWGT
ncbi:hypothetical protein BS78_05G222900 [Paspalum vaginatum]|nr:hypothetical protein BS78_05G222900 [Paspalum vaginatum]